MGVSVLFEAEGTRFKEDLLLMTRCRMLAVTALMLALAATSVRAQGAFYREVEKDGRIYVFNIAAQFAAFDKSGEMGVAITKLNYGPNGETMVFDSVDAIHLYNFKHGRPGDAAQMAEVPAKPPKQIITWKDGRTTLETDFATISLNNRIQLRFTDELPDSETTLPAGVPISGTAQAPNKGDSRGSFRVRRAEMKFAGWFWKPTLTFEFEMNFADPTSDINDAQLTWDASKNGTFQIKMGQFKVPFGRQELTSSTAQQFVDRSIVATEYNKGRDAGVSIQGLLMKQRLDYRLGVFNGNQRNKATNDNTKFQYNGRLIYQPWGDHKYSEADFDTVPGGKPLLAVGVQFELNDMKATTTAVDQKRTMWGPEIALKHQGFSLFADAYFRELDPEPQTAGAAATKFNSDGWQVQAGYFLYKRRWEVAARYATWDPSDLVENNERVELGGCLSFYENKHALKVQSDFRQVEDKARKVKDKEFRIQTQFMF